MEKLIAIVEDEPDIRELVSLHLKKSNFKVEEFATGHDLLAFLDKKIPDLVILDLMLPDLDGFDICREIRRNDRLSDIQVIMLTAKGEETDKIVGLELGADDYITKPFSPRELVARVKAVLRRHPGNEKSKVVKIGDSLTVDLQKYLVFVDGEKIHTTTTEFKILEILCEKKGWVYSRRQMLNQMWGHNKIVVDRTIDVHVNNLRNKLGDAGRYIKNIRGVGYKIEE